MTDASPPVRRRRHWRRWVLLALLLVLAAATARLVQKSRATPEWWSQNQSFLKSRPPAELKKLASAVALRAPREWTRPVGEGDGDRTLSFGFDEINAWLALNLDSVLKNQSVALPGLAGAMLAERDGRLLVAVNRDDGTLFKVFSVFLDVDQAVAEDGDGTAEPTFRIHALRAGDQNVPLSFIAKAAKPDRIQDPGTRALVEQLAAGKAVGPLILPVDAHRQARVRAFRVTESGIEADVRVSYVDKGD